jgi:hypothetical protein
LKHFASPDFWQLYKTLPQFAQVLADKSYSLLKNDPYHPSLHLKRLAVSGLFVSACIIERLRWRLPMDCFGFG